MKSSAKCLLRSTIGSRFFLPRFHNTGVSGKYDDAGEMFMVRGDTKENAYFYNLQKQQLSKIKGLREKSSQIVKYQMVKPSQLPLVHKLMYESGYPREPMVQHLGLCKGTHSIPDSDKIMEDLVMTYNMSVLAMDKTRNVPLGVAVNGEFTLGDVQEDVNMYMKRKSGQLLSPGYAPIIAIRQEVDTMGKEVFKQFNTDVLFQTKFLTVATEIGMQGLATTMLSRAIQQGSALGYKGIKTVVSHDGFKKAALDNGMKLICEVKFNEFTYKGEKVFAGMKQKSLAFFAMKLDS